MQRQTNIAASLGNLGVVCCFLQDYAEARRYYEEALTLHSEAGNQWGAAIALHNLGDIARRQNDLPAAQSLLRKSLELRVALGDKMGSILTLEACADVAGLLGAYEQAVLLMSAAHTMRQVIAVLPTEEERKQADHILVMAQAGSTSSAYTSIWAKGNTLSIKEILAHV